MLTEILQHLNFTSPTWVYALPLILMGVDILTGLVNACFKEKNFQSSVMRAGLTKKVGEISIIVVAIVCTYGLGIPTAVMKGIVAYIVFMELMSILENADKMGVPIPRFVKTFINNVNDTIQNDDLQTTIDKIHKLEAVLEANGISYRDIDDLK